MTDRQIMQQALEALEGIRWPGSPSFVKAAITALRERLAQTEQEPEYDWEAEYAKRVELHNQTLDELRDALVQPEQPGDHKPAPTIPLGYTHDEHGNVLTFRDSDGYWFEYTRDADGNVMAYKNSDGHWYEYTRDADGNELTFRDSNGCWREYTRDEHGNVLTFREGEIE